MDSTFEKGLRTRVFIEEDSDSNGWHEHGDNEGLFISPS